MVALFWLPARILVVCTRYPFFSLTYFLLSRAAPLFLLVWAL